MRGLIIALPISIILWVFIIYTLVRVYKALGGIF